MRCVSFSASRKPASRPARSFTSPIGFPERRARILGAFLLAVPLSSAIGAPLSSLALAAMDGVGGLKGWQWLFLLEAIPSMLLGMVACFYLTDKPKDADG